MDIVLRNAQLAAATGGEEEGKALLVALTRAGMLPTLSAGREIQSVSIETNVDRIRLTEQTEYLGRCRNCNGYLSKGRDVAIWTVSQDFLPFCCASCRTTYRNHFTRKLQRTLLLLGEFE